MDASVDNSILGQAMGTTRRKAKVTASPADVQQTEDYYRPLLREAVGTIRESAHKADDLKPPPDLQLPPPPQPTYTPPLQQWGSIAMAVAALGSVLTRTPLTTALNSMAGVMNSYHRGDVEGWQQHVQEWKVATDNAIKLHDFQLKAYSNALSKAGLDIKAATASLTAIAAATRDDMMLSILKARGLAGGVQGGVDLLGRRAGAFLKLQEQQDKLDALHEWQHDFNVKNGRLPSKLEQVRFEATLGKADKDLTPKEQEENDQIKLDHEFIKSYLPPEEGGPAHAKTTGIYGGGDAGPSPKQAELAAALDNANPTPRQKLLVQRYQNAQKPPMGGEEGGGPSFDPSAPLPVPTPSPGAIPRPAAPPAVATPAPGSAASTPGPGYGGPPVTGGGVPISGAQAATPGGSAGAVGQDPRLAKAGQAISMGYAREHVRQIYIDGGGNAALFDQAFPPKPQ